MHATVFVPKGKIGVFIRKFEEYLTRDRSPGTPSHKALVESISKVRLAALESFWTDAQSFPQEPDTPFWWEVWLHESTSPHDTSQVFRSMAQAAGIEIALRELRFTERRVLLARATVRQWLAVENLADVLAELRLAKTLAGEFLKMSSRAATTAHGRWANAFGARAQSTRTHGPVLRLSWPNAGSSPCSP